MSDELARKDELGVAKVFGPYPFAFDSAGIQGPGYKLLDIPQDFLVLDVWAVTTEPFLAPFTTVSSVSIAVGHRATWAADFYELKRYTSSPGAPVGIEFTPGTAVLSRAWAAPYDAALGIFIACADAMSQGQGGLYLMGAGSLS